MAANTGRYNRRRSRGSEQRAEWQGERVKGWQTDRQRDRQIDSLERDSDSKTSRREEQNGENE